MDSSASAEAKTRFVTESLAYTVGQRRTQMKTHLLLRTAAGAAFTLGGIALAGWLSIPPSVHAQDNRGDNHGDRDLSRIIRGLEIAPVPLNLEGKDINLVGLGSYWVNAVSDCNSCHTAGGPPNFNYAAGGNPYFGEPQKIDPTTYLAGGTDFGPALPPGFYAPGYGTYIGPDIVSRNLTPDKTGLPEGSHTFEQFLA